MITPGTILIERGAPRPKCFELEDGVYPFAWMAVKHSLNSYELEQELVAGGWTFFSMANEVRATAVGFDRAKLINSSLKRLIAEVKHQRCNCLEIEEVATHSFLGVPYIVITGHPRHIQKGVVFIGTSAQGGAGSPSIEKTARAS